nr:hypothetical protein [uncultured Draconibacterium sp.]
MEDIKKIKEKLEIDKELDSNIDLLVDFTIKHRTLIYEPDVEKIDIDVLQKSGIIKLQNNKIQILNYSLFGYKFYKIYENSLSPELTEDFSSFVKFVDQIEKEFKGDKFTSGFISLKKELWGIAILEANEMFQIEFVNYLNSLSFEKDQEEIFSFNEGYSIAIPYIQVETEAFYSNIKKLIQWTKSDADYNMPLGVLLKGIRDRFFINPEFGLNCFRYTIAQKEFEIDSLIPMISGLYDKLRLEFYNNHLKPLLENQSYSIAIICGLANVQTITNVEVQLFFQLIDKTDKQKSELLIYLPRLIFAILNSKEDSINSKDIGNSFKILEELIDIDNPNLIHYILRQLRFHDNHFAAQQDLIKKLIVKSHFQVDNYLNPINQILWNQKDVKFFGVIIELVASHHPFKSLSNFLSSSIHEFTRSNKSEFDKILVKVLIDDRASLRFVGKDIFDKVSQDSYTFDFNILELESINQYKLWVSILQTYREPKYVIPCLLPLLKSNSSFVKEAFTCKLEEYSENYGGGLTKVLKKKLDIEDKELNKIHKRIENHLDFHFKTFITPKKEINELNPLYAQNKIYTDFNKNYFRSFGKQMKKHSDESNSFLNLISKVTLLKGGGWKTEGRKDISKLSKISSSFSLPRIYFIEPEVFDFENSRELATNWNDETFAEVKSVLDNE